MHKDKLTTILFGIRIEFIYCYKQSVKIPQMVNFNSHIDQESHSEFEPKIKCIWTCETSIIYTTKQSLLFVLLRCAFHISTLWDRGGLNSFQQAFKKNQEEKQKVRKTKHQMKICNGLPGHSCHLVIKQELQVQKTFEWRSVTLPKSKKRP